ncbi:SRPBCC domain-containing protein [Actinomadura sp. NTSP31]|uniref:SRPBCC family protein n=1 Tax=Actinomadura sp. NTSP31 TaxID=1735447 RepID=UPI0035C07978
MAKEFEIVREFEVDAPPERVWDAITVNTAGWLWPTEYEPREGGAAAFGATVTAWDPPHRLVARSESPEELKEVGQVLNQLDHLIEPREGGRSWVRYVHSGIFVENWDDQYDGANKHTDFYLHTLRQYLMHFAGRPAVHTDVQGPEASAAKGSFAAVGPAFGLGASAADGAAEGDRVRVDLPGVGVTGAVVDFRNDDFLGLRTEDAMYRFFGRDAWGAPVGIALHRFAPGAAGDEDATRKAWQSWLDGLYA